MAGIGSYFKKHTEALVKDIDIEMACTLTGKSRATLGRYYSDSPEPSDRFMPVDAVARLEETASYPHVTGALAELKNITLSYGVQADGETRPGGVNRDVVALSQPFANLMRNTGRPSRTASSRSMKPNDYCGKPCCCNKSSSK